MASPTNTNVSGSTRDNSIDHEHGVSCSSSPSSANNMASAGRKDNDYIPLNIAEDDNTTGRSHNSTRRPLNRRALVAFAAISVAVIIIVSLSVIIVVYSGDNEASQVRWKKEATIDGRFSFDDLFNWKYYAEFPTDEWISDDNLLSVDNEDDVFTYDVSSRIKSTLFTREQLNKLDIPDVHQTEHFLSPDKSWMLFMLNSTKKYRYSSVGKYIAVKIATQESVKISTAGTDTFSPIEYISWGGNSNSIVFVSDNDIYWKGKVDDATTTRITNTGKEKIFFNGIPDWVYEEEILGNRPSVVVSPNEEYLCYASFNDTNVPLYEISMYGDADKVYTRIEDIAYPKPGFPNPDVHIYVYNLEKDENTVLLPPKDLREGDFYFSNLVWADSKTVSVTWMNRAQNTSVVMLCSAQDGSCIENYRVVVQDGWVSQDYFDPLFASDGSFYIQVLPKNQGTDGDFYHIAVVQSTAHAEKTVKFLTSGTWDVTKVVSFDEKNGLIYYESAEVSYTQKHLYSVSLKDSVKKCLTCVLNETKSGRCHYYFTKFSKKSSWYILNCQGPGIPISWIRSSNSHKEFVYEDNKQLQEALADVTLPTFKYFTVDTTDGKYGIQVRELRPPDFDEKKKYAVIFTVYGGPGSQQISESFQTGFPTYLTSNFDVILCEVDGRGTKARGREFMSSVYYQLGEFEKDDTLAAAKYMQSKSYVDPDRISIWGWSYGGFLSSFILTTQKEKVFQSAIAVAPVTDWRYYDSIYTERFMGQPSKDDNLIGYESSSVLTHAAKMPDNSFLLIHGTGDDNVHFQNSAQLIEVLTQADVQFNIQIYTDKHHALEGENIKRHLYHRMTAFFQEKLRL